MYEGKGMEIDSEAILKETIGELTEKITKDNFDRLHEKVIQISIKKYNDELKRRSEEFGKIAWKVLKEQDAASTRDRSSRTS